MRGEPDGPPSRLLEEAVDGQFFLVFPQRVRAELHRALVEKLGFTLERATAAGELLAQLATERPGAPKRIEAITGEPADEAILASAIEAVVDVLVTGRGNTSFRSAHITKSNSSHPQVLLAEFLNED